VEIKCQLDATGDFLLQILLITQHVSGTTMPIIRSSRVLYRWLLPVVLGALLSKLLVWCGAESYVSGLRAECQGKPSLRVFDNYTVSKDINPCKKSTGLKKQTSDL